MSTQQVTGHDKPTQEVIQITPAGLNAPAGTLADPIFTTSSGAVPSTTSPTKQEDAPHTSGDYANAVLYVRNDANATLTSTDMDYGTPTVDAAGNTRVVGNVASGAADSGNPVKISGVFNTTPPPVTTGQRSDLQTTANGVLKTTITNSAGTTVATFVTASDGLSNGTFANAITVGTAAFNFDGTTWDRQRGDTTGTYVVGAPSAGTDRSITTSVASAQLMAANTSRHGFYIKNDSAIVVWINIGAAAVAAAGSGNIAIAANGGYYESPASVTPSSVVNIIAASATPAITCREF